MAEGDIKVLRENALGTFDEVNLYTYFEKGDYDGQLLVWNNSTGKWTSAASTLIEASTWPVVDVEAIMGSCIIHSAVNGNINQSWRHFGGYDVNSAFHGLYVYDKQTSRSEAATISLQYRDTDILKISGDLTSYTPLIQFPTLTSNGFLKVSGSNGTVGVDTASYGTSNVSVANQADNRLLTATGTTDALNAEANLTFDGTNLQVTGYVGIGISPTEAKLEIATTGSMRGLYINQTVTASASAVRIIANVDGASGMHFTQNGNGYGIYAEAGNAACVALHVEGHASSSGNIFEVDKGTARTMTITSGGNLSIGDGTDAFVFPLTKGSNGQALRIPVGGGTMEWYTPGGGGVSCANQADNRVVTATGTTDALNAEANLLFNGTQLGINNSPAAALDALGDTYLHYVTASNEADEAFTLLDLLIESRHNYTGNWDGAYIGINLYMPKYGSSNITPYNGVVVNQEFISGSSGYVYELNLFKGLFDLKEDSNATVGTLNGLYLNALNHTWNGFDNWRAISIGTGKPATSNYAIYGGISTGDNCWNLYINGTALNYLNGNLGIKASSALSTLEVNGSVGLTPSAQTTSITLGDKFLYYTRTSSLTWTLPIDVDKRSYIVLNGSSGNLTIARGSGQTINGAGSDLTAAAGTAYWLTLDGTDWVAIQIK